MKKIVFLFFISISLLSCSEYQKVLNKGEVNEQYKMAQDLYEAGKYGRAITLFEKVIPSFERKPQMQRIQFMVAKANFETKNYSLAAYYFNRFISNYPSSSKIEEADYLVTQSYYRASQRYSLDQKDTDKALGSLQGFLEKYPDSQRTEEINGQYAELSEKLEKKAYEIAKLYYKTERFTSSIVAFDNFIADFLGTKYKEDALFYKFKAANDLSLKSVLYKKEKRIENAISYYNRFNKLYPESKYTNQSIDLVDKLNKELEKVKSLNIKKYEGL